jgi:limonene-1,2-epoxide hydrolase
MKKLSLVFLIFIIFGCSSGNDISSDAQEKINVVDQYIKAIEKKDINSITNLLADDYVSYGPGLKTEVSKAQNIADWQKSWEERIVSMKYKRAYNGMIHIDKGKLAGEWVSEWGQVTTLYKDGKNVKFWFNGLYKVADGKITEAKVVFDNMDILTQLGYKFMPPADIIDESGN